MDHRKTVSKIRILLVPLLFALSTMPVNAGLAQFQNPIEIDSLEELISVVSNFIRPMIIVALIGVLIYGGWVRMSARDNDEAVAKSQKIIVSALVGFAIIVLAPIIVEFFGSLIGVQGSLVDIN